MGQAIKNHQQWRFCKSKYLIKNLTFVPSDRNVEFFVQKMSELLMVLNKNLRIYSSDGILATPMLAVLSNFQFWLNLKLNINSYNLSNPKVPIKP